MTRKRRAHHADRKRRRLDETERAIRDHDRRTRRRHMFLTLDLNAHGEGEQRHQHVGELGIESERIDRIAAGKAAFQCAPRRFGPADAIGVERFQPGNL
jgi:hypothetical protein